MFHTIIIVGNVGRDPEMRYTPAGLPVTSFSVASNRNYKSQGQTVKETTWFRVTCWNKTAEIASSYVKKGTKVLIEGRLVSDPLTGGPRTFTRQDGSVSASYEVSATTMQILSSRSESDGFSGNGNSGAIYSDNPDRFTEGEMDESDIPF